MKPKVSVCIFTYNHEKYIEQCIESVLMQKTDFAIEILLGEDYSTDRTRNICKSYEREYPDKIKLLDRGRNLGLCENYLNSLQSCSGEYIALLDGDDYWIHPMKLQKQHDYLTKNPDCNLVFHQTIRINELNNKLDFFVRDIQTVYTFEDVVNHWIMATGAVFFRKSAMKYPEFLKHTYNFDLAIQMLVSMDNSRIGYLNELMSVYRINTGSNTNNPDFNLLNTWKRLKLLYEEFDLYTEGAQSRVINQKLSQFHHLINSHGKFNLKNHIKNSVKKVLSILGYQLFKAQSE